MLYYVSFSFLFYVFFSSSLFSCFYFIFSHINNNFEYIAKMKNVVSRFYSIYFVAFVIWQSQIDTHIQIILIHKKIIHPKTDTHTHKFIFTHIHTLNTHTPTQRSIKTHNTHIFNIVRSNNFVWHSHTHTHTHTKQANNTVNTQHTICSNNRMCNIVYIYLKW